MSRLNAACLKCSHVSSRNDFFVPQPRQVPSYTDICPRCASDDVEVYDPKVSMPSYLDPAEYS